MTQPQPVELKVEISTDFLSDMFCRQGLERERQIRGIRRAVASDGADNWCRTIPFQDLWQFSVWDVWDEFAARLDEVVRTSSPTLLTELRQQFLTLGRDCYHEPQFSVEDQNVIDWLGLRLLRPHGQISQLSGNDVSVQNCYLPDLSLDVRFYAFFGSDRSLANGPRHMIDNAHSYDSEEATGVIEGDTGLATIQCHLCDTLLTAFTRARTLADRLLQADRPNWAVGVELENRSTLVIDALVGGFRGYQSLRASDPSVPLIGAHPEFSRAAIRQGLGYAQVSASIPRKEWASLSDIAKDAVTAAAEAIAIGRTPPISPLIPRESEMQEINKIGGYAQLDVDVTELLQQQAHTLRKLGIHDVVFRRHSQEGYMERLETFNWAWDWTWALDEVMASLYDSSIERSHRNAQIYRLQPLHKRLLSIFEQSVIAPLRAKVSSGAWVPKGGNAYQASNLWRDAFDGTVAVQPYSGWNDYRATLDIQGHWLIHATGSTTGHCRLTDLLDQMLAERVRHSPDLAGSTLTLAPLSPGAMAQQIREISEPSDRARSITMFLGRVALELRNFIEHGLESPDGDTLVIRNEDIWNTNREYAKTGKKGGKRRAERIPLTEWIAQTASDQNWPREAALPTGVPPSASQIVLDTGSLSHCLALTTIVLAGAQAHLSLS